MCGRVPPGSSGQKLGTLAKQMHREFTMLEPKLMESMKGAAYCEEMRGYLKDLARRVLDRQNLEGMLMPLLKRSEQALMALSRVLSGHTRSGGRSSTGDIRRAWLRCILLTEKLTKGGMIHLPQVHWFLHQLLRATEECVHAVMGSISLRRSMLDHALVSLHQRNKTHDLLLELQAVAFTDSDLLLATEAGENYLAQLDIYLKGLDPKIRQVLNIEPSLHAIGAVRSICRRIIPLAENRIRHEESKQSSLAGEASMASAGASGWGGGGGGGGHGGGGGQGGGGGGSGSPRRRPDRALVPAGSTMSAVMQGYLVPDEVLRKDWRALNAAMHMLTLEEAERCADITERARSLLALILPEVIDGASVEDTASNEIQAHDAKEASRLGLRQARRVNEIVHFRIVPVSEKGDLASIAELWDGIEGSPLRRLPSMPTGRVPRLAREWRTVRIIVSAVGKDTSVERALLRTRVLPSLASVAAKLRIHLLLIDLTEEPTAVESLRDIARAREEVGSPFMIYLLGEKHGENLVAHETDLLLRDAAGYVPGCSLQELQFALGTLNGS